MKKIFLLFLLIHPLIGCSVFAFNLYKTHNTYIFSLSTEEHNTSLESGWERFHACAFQFPHFLSTLQKSDRVILLVPKDLEGTTPLAKRAPWIEGARVALTWASAYFRFSSLGNLDIRVLQTDTAEPFLEDKTVQALSNLSLLSIIDNPQSTPEEQISQRIFFPEQITQNTAPLSFEPINFPSAPIEEPLIIKPNLIEDPSVKRFLVTGGAGFIGSHLVKKLLEQGHQVIALDNLSCSTMHNIETILDNPHFFFAKVDITEPFTVEGPLCAIIHLASVPSPEAYYAKPAETLRSGLHGTKNSLELARLKNALYLISSTSEVYGDPEVHPQMEEYAGKVNTIGKRSQYDQSKRGAETLIKLYYEKYNLDVRIARIFNTYGPYMQLGDGRVVTNFIRAALHNEPIITYGTGQQTRSFAYVDDTVTGIMKLVETSNITPQTPLDSRVFNIGSPIEFSVYDLAKKINILSKQYLNREMPIKSIKQTDPTDPKLRRPDITKARTVLGFNPCISLEEGLHKTFCYFLNNKK